MAPQQPKLNTTPLGSLIRLTDVRECYEGSEGITLRRISGFSSFTPVSATQSCTQLPNFRYHSSFRSNIASNYYSPGLCPQRYTTARIITYDKDDSIGAMVASNEIWGICCPKDWKNDNNEGACSSSNLNPKGSPQEYSTTYVAPINIRWNPLMDVETTITQGEGFTEVYISQVTTAQKSTAEPTGTSNPDSTTSSDSSSYSSQSTHSSSSSVNAGEIAGITIGLVASIALVLFIVYKIRQSHRKHEARKREIGSRVVPTVPEHHREDFTAAALPPPDYSFRPRNGEIPMEDLLAMTREVPDQDSGIGDIERPRMRGGVFLGSDPAPEYTESVEDLREVRGRRGLPGGSGSGGTGTPVVPTGPAPDYTESMEDLPRRIGLIRNGTSESLMEPLRAHLPPRS